MLFYFVNQCETVFLAIPCFLHVAMQLRSPSISFKALYLSARYYLCLQINVLQDLIYMRNVASILSK